MGNCHANSKLLITPQTTLRDLSSKLAFFEEEAIVRRLQKQITDYKTLIPYYMILLSIEQSNIDDLPQIFASKLAQLPPSDKSKRYRDIQHVMSLWLSFIKEYLIKLSNMLVNIKDKEDYETLQLLVHESIQFSLELIIVKKVIQLKCLKGIGQNFWEGTYYYDRKRVLNNLKVQKTSENLLIESDLENLLYKRNIIFAPLFEMYLFIKNLTLICTFDAQLSQMIFSNYGHSLVNSQTISKKEKVFPLVTDRLIDHSADRKKEQFTTSVQNEIKSQEVKIGSLCRRYVFDLKAK